MRLAGKLATILSTLAVSGLLYAQSSAVSVPANGSGNTKREAKNRPAILVTPEREAAVLTFVQRNHAELAELLAALKTNDPEQYERAIRDIYRTTERMAQVQERDPLQYELEVTAWTAQSRVELLAARLKMGSTDELMKQLREALKTQNDTKLALLKHERQKAADRLGKLDSEIARFQTSSDELVNKQLKVLARTAGEGRPAKTSAKIPAKQKKAPPTAP